MTIEYYTEVAQLADELRKLSVQIDWLIRKTPVLSKDFNIYIAAMDEHSDYWNNKNSLTLSSPKTIKALVPDLIGILNERRLAAKLQLKAKLETSAPVDGGKNE